MLKKRFFLNHNQTEHFPVKKICGFSCNLDMSIHVFWNTKIMKRLVPWDSFLQWRPKASYLPENILLSSVPPT